MQALPWSVHDRRDKFSKSVFLRVPDSDTERSGWLPDALSPSRRKSIRQAQRKLWSPADRRRRHGSPMLQPVPASMRKTVRNIVPLRNNHKNTACEVSGDTVSRVLRQPVSRFCRTTAPGSSNPGPGKKEKVRSNCVSGQVNQNDKFAEFCFPASCALRIKP